MQNCKLYTSIDCKEPAIAPAMSPKKSTHPGSLFPGGRAAIAPCWNGKVTDECVKSNDPKSFKVNKSSHYKSSSPDLLNKKNAENIHNMYVCLHSKFVFFSS